MASKDSSWIADVVGDFIHSQVWAAPINTFIEIRCAAFDYDDDIKDEDDTDASLESSVEEQSHIYEQYQHLVDALIESLGQDLGLDEKELKEACQLPTTVDNAVVIDETYEQLYSARDFQLFQEMMRRKNLILQLQALVSLQLQWGLLKPGEAGDDLVLSLLLQATTHLPRRLSVDQPTEPVKQRAPIEQFREKKPVVDDDDDDDDVVVVPQKQPSPPPKKRQEKIVPPKPAREEYRLPGLRRKGGEGLNADWYRELRPQNEDDDEDLSDDDQSKQISTPQTIGAVSQQVLREKLRELTDRTTSSVDDETSAAVTSRKNFLQKQRDLILKKQRDERERNLEEETRAARPQSAIHVARKSMATTKKTEPEPQTQMPNDDELLKRRSMVAKIKREVVDKR